MLGEYVKIEPHLGFSDVAQLFDEVSRKGVSADDVITALAHGDIVKSGTSSFGHVKTFLIRKHGAVFFHQNDEQMIHLCRRLFDEIMMPAGKRVAVHHDHSRGSLLPQRLKVSAVSGHSLG